MTGEVPTKLRLVRCPKCRRVLPELPNVPVYQCGGCGTVLQAKKRKVASEDAESLVTESVSVHQNELKNISSKKEAQNLSPVETTRENIQTETQIYSVEHSVDDESSPEISNKLMHLRHKEPSTDVEEEECVSDDAESSNGSSDDLMHLGSIVSPPDVDLDEFVSKNAESSMEFPENLQKHGNVETSPEINIDACSPKQIDSNDKLKNLHHKEKPHMRVSFSGELVYLTEHNQLEHEEGDNEALLELANEPNQKESLTVVKTDFKSNEEFKIPNEFGSSPEEEILSESVSNSDRLKLYHDRTSFYNLERMSSINTVDNIAALRDMPESPMTRSYYGFYGSGSSCDGTDDQFHDRSFHLRDRNFEEREISNRKSFSRNDEVPYKVRSNQEMQAQNGYFSSGSSGKRRPTHHVITTYEKKNETTGHQPRVPLHQRDHELGYSNENYSNNEMGMNSHLPNKREYLEVEKMELLRKVHELQDQLNRTYISGDKKSGNFSRPVENETHTFHDNFMYDQDFGRYHEGRSVCHQSRPLQSSFPSEATTSRNKVDPLSDFPLHIYNAKSELNDIGTNAKKIRAERLYLGKKHSLPIAGGAPFLLCYGCSEVLQIPADFLLFKRRYHKLKCGSCSVTLKFSLLNRTHIAIYIDHSSKDLSQIDPISIDNYEPSYCKDFSTDEAADRIEPPFDYLKRNFSEKNKPSGKKGNIFTNLVKTLGSVRFSSRRSKEESSASEKEETTTSANSPLHRLMGYQSATFLLKPDAEF